ncbi:FecR domain-containing protein [Sphingomonas sp. R647]|uniref:FecR family protein n=1 Tax=Sphingomonas sp. R647 TaxID=2875233 RepID=UPI001CD565AC|nr:FecR domain-containing protein [Sphingomonas sp. R647]MCA1197262.1 FecR domain-containing protein [Sphingomonas sp. R647]
MREAIETEAARWALRHPLSGQERVALEAWLAAHPHHPGALLRAQAALSSIDRAIAPATAPVAEEVPAPATPSRRWILAGAGSIAAAAAVTAAIGLRGPSPDRVATGPGEIRRMPLADGSIAAMDAESELRIALAKDARRIDLRRGHVWFQVAKDRQRPFIVDAGIAKVQAVGTAFSVTRTSAGVRIAVTEGRVAIWASDASGAVSILDAGEFAAFRSDGTAPVTGSAPSAIERSLAWREGEIALEGETLDEAVAAFNRYNQQQLVVRDAALGRERLVGLFQLNNPVGFATTLEATLDVEVTVTSSEISLSRNKNVAK